MAEFPATIDVSSPAVLSPDAVTTTESTVLDGSVFADNGSGPDSDPTPHSSWSARSTAMPATSITLSCCPRARC